MTAPAPTRYNAPDFRSLEMIGFDRGLRDAWDDLMIVAPTNSTVLIQGETGTGKELFAHALHQASRRSRGPFVKINCAAIPAGLLESELFGHERGAFTGAITSMIGRFQLAHNGTLFLDEIADLPIELQPKLLRVLQEQEFERLGSSRTIKIDVRVVGATNQDLSTLVTEKRFRTDLFYRVNIFPITLPPLRVRRDDIPDLVRHFVREFAHRMNKQPLEVSESTMSVLCDHDWPGNVRELQNVVERAVIRSWGSRLEIRFQEFVPKTKHRIESGDQTLDDVQRELILAVLSRTGGVVAGPRGAAKRLGLPRTTLMYRMRKLGMT
jgi:formate hydrogenlyase transcriptional activator